MNLRRRPHLPASPARRGTAVLVATTTDIDRGAVMTCGELVRLLGGIHPDTPIELEYPHGRRWAVDVVAPGAPLIRHTDPSRVAIR